MMRLPNLRSCDRQPCPKCSKKGSGCHKEGLTRQRTSHILSTPFLHLRCQCIRFSDGLPQPIRKAACQHALNRVSSPTSLDSAQRGSPRPIYPLHPHPMTPTSRSSVLLVISRALETRSSSSGAKSSTNPPLGIRKIPAARSLVNVRPRPGSFFHRRK